MFKNILLVLLLAISIHAKNGLSQTHLVSVLPEVSALEVSSDSSIKVEFDLPIDVNSVKKHTISLKLKHKNIKGITTVENENTLLFTPDQPLDIGKYDVKVDKIKLLDFSNNNNHGFKKYARKICSHFYDDIKKCFMCRYACNIKTRKINYSFNVDDAKSRVISLTLNKSNIKLKENNQTSISVSATYDDNTTQDVTENVEWIIGDTSVISISKNTITSLSEGTTSLKARFDGMDSQEINVTVYKEINGYKLPPEPDPTLNNSTLLGIDSNNNGVRDDVEIYVIKRYAKDPEFPKTKTALAMQYAWSAQKILENPTIESKKYSDDAIDCESYWFNIITESMTTLEMMKYMNNHEVFNDPEIKDKIYNTRERIEQKFSYNSALSGNIFDGRNESIDNCQININELGE